MAELQARIASDLAKRKERTFASALPTRGAGGAWSTPSGNPLTKVYVVSWSAPEEQEGIPTTAFYDAASNEYWLHEGGGISGINTWYGPFVLPE